MSNRPDHSEYKYGIKEVRTDGVGAGLVFARFLFSDDRDRALRSIRKADRNCQSGYIRLVPVRFGVKEDK